MRRSVFVLAIALFGLMAAGCETTQQRLQRSIRQAFEQDPNAGNVLCGYPVLGLMNVAVSGVTNQGTSSSGTGQATVTGTPRTFTNTGGSPCAGTVSFSYDTSTSSSWSSRGRRTTTSIFRVYNIVLTNRAGGAAPTPPMGGMGGMPGMGGMGIPNMGGMGNPRMPTMPRAPMPTAVGMVVPGSLAPGDMPLQNGGVADDYSVMLTAGMPVTIVLRGGPSTTNPGGNIDVYLMLLFNGQVVAQNDDSNGFDSRIIYTPAASGMYTIRATTFASGTYGMYTMQTFPGANPLAQ